MCGIGGILRTDGQPIPEEWLDAIDARIAYRGPDGHGRFRDRVEIDDPNAPGGKRIVEVAFVHRRLSIIDHKDGHQPMVSERGRNDKEGLVAVVFNGCIYNHRELRKELEAKGHTFVTDHSDTEVLIHGWREWGEGLPMRLDGMFAFAVWDRTRVRLLLFRDFRGEKPLYVNVESDITRFCSAARGAATSDSALCSQFRNHDLDRYLQLGYVSWRGRVATKSSLDLVAPNGGFRWHRGEIGDSEFDDLGCAPATPSLNVEQLLDRAVARQLEADVPLGCFLSGGVDSSIVTYFARKHRSDVLTFCVRMPDTRFDESSYAQMAANAIGTRHHTLDVAMNPATDLVELIEKLGLPFGDSSILPTHWVCKAARKHVKVALSGDGGDELFLGYERHRAARFIARHWNWLRRIPLSALHRAHRKSRLNKIARAIDMARDLPRMGIVALEAVFTWRELTELLAGREPQVVREIPDADPLTTIRHFDLMSYLPDDLLRKSDTASMACALEVRSPLLDRELQRGVLALTMEQLMPGGQRKGLLRQIARKYLPKEIVDRPKMGFAIPIGEWFRSDYGNMKTLLLDHLNSIEPFGPIQLNRKAVQRFIDEHMAGRRDHGQRLFTLLTLSIWARQVAR